MASTPSAAAQSVGQGQIERIDYRKLAWVAPLAAIVASILNLVIYAIGRAGNVVMVTNGIDLPAVAVVASSITGVVGGTIAYALLGRFTSRPISIFRIVGLIVLVLSLAGRFFIPARGAFLAIMLGMHIVAGVVTVGMLTTLARRA